MTDTITLANAEHMELPPRARSRTNRAKDTRQIWLFPLLADGHLDWASERVDCGRRFEVGSHIQAPDRKDPVLTPHPARPSDCGFYFFQHGTLSPYVALNTKPNDVLGKAVDRRTYAEFVVFLTDSVIKRRR